MVNNVENNKKKKGFTLIELIIVIAIIAILAAIAIPKFGEVRKNANRNADIANAKQIQSAVSLVIADNKTTNDTETFTWGTAGDKTIQGESYKQLQSANIKSKLDNTKQFVVKVDGGDIKVYISSSESNITAENQVYPEPSDTTNNIWYGGKPAKE